jgi:Tfp pilus assembly protein PilV
MVSATRIVEIRVITANSEEIKRLRHAEVAEVSAGPKHAKASSSKYYQTRGSAAGSPGDCVQLPCYRRVAVSTASAFKRWVRWARKALGQSRAKNF